jgi:hypothetical protein
MRPVAGRGTASRMGLLPGHLLAWQLFAAALCMAGVLHGLLQAVAAPAAAAVVSCTVAHYRRVLVPMASVVLLAAAAAALSGPGLWGRS